MSGLSTSARNPLCLSCIRQLVADDLSQSWFPFHRQLRGKKKAVKRTTTINVKLLKDVRGYGKKDSITPVEPGRMRNSWYPRQMAEYMTVSSLHGLKPQKLEAVRDFMFGMEQPEEDSTPASTTVEEEMVTGVQTRTKLLPPLRATEIMEATLPPQIVFYRTPIAHTEPETLKSPRPRAASSAAAAVLDAASETSKPSKPPLATIYGSVSTADIADSMKAVLGETEEGARVVLSAEDIKFVEDEGSQEPREIGIEGDRLKALGDFKVEARVKGGEAVMRTVSVRAQNGDSST